MKRLLALLLVFSLVIAGIPAVLSAGGILTTITPTSQDANPGDTVTFTFKVDLNGNVGDEIKITVSDTQGWSVTASPSTITVQYGTTVYSSTITVTVPSSATPGTSDTITVTATLYSRGSVVSSSSKSATVNVVSAGAPDVQLSATTTSQNADPSTSVSFTVTLKNNGTQAGNYTITASDTNNWAISLSQTSASLDANGSVDITVTVSVPFVQAGTTDTITVTAKETSTNTERSIQLSITVNAYISFSLSTDTLTWSGQPGENVTANVTVTVTSNKNFNVLVSGTDFSDGNGHTIPTGYIHVDRDGNSPYDLTLSTNAQVLYNNHEWGQNVELPVYFIVSIPVGLPPGEYNGTLYINVEQS